MGLFGKKKKVAPQDANAPVETTKPSKIDKKAKKKKKNELVKVLDESVWESVHEDLKANTQFIMTDADGNTKYIALLLDTSLIGGLAGKEARKDESKGSIIEAIHTGHIKTYIRTEMLMDNSFIIIPDKETIDNMDEFVILTSVDYTVCSITDDGMIMTETQNGTDAEDDPELTVAYDQIKELIDTGDDIRNIFPSQTADMSDDITTDSDADSVEGIEDLPDDMSDEAVEDLPDDMLDDGLDDGLSDDVSTDDISDGVSADNTSATSVAENDAATETSDDTIDADDIAVTDDASAAADDGGFTEYDDVTEDVVNDFVVRKFYSDDLGLEVSTQPFDAQFLHGNSYLPFNENRGTGWLNEYIANLAKDANTCMERMHNENLFRMRERYMRLIQAHCKSISDLLDTGNDTTQYGRIKLAIEQNKSDNIAQVEASVAGKRDQLEDSWEHKLEQIGDEAAAEAKQQYIDRYGKAHDNDICQLESHEKDEIERDYQNSIRCMNEERRNEASKMLDLAVNTTLTDMANLQLRVLRDEKKEYIRLQNQITCFIDDNRKDEKARIEALAEENRQVKKANEVRADYTAKIKAMSAEFDMKKTVLQADIDKLSHDHELELASKESDWASKLTDEKTKSQALQNQVDTLLEKYADLDTQKKQEYESRVSELEQLNKTKEDDINHIIDTHKKANAVSVVLIIAIMIAALGAGFMCGSIMNVRKTSQIEQQSVYEQYQNDNSDKDVQEVTPDQTPSDAQN